MGSEYIKNQQITLEIMDMGTDGEGIGKIDGYPFFVKDAVIGDVIEARVTKAKKQYAYGRLEKVLTPSPFRVEPKCQYYKQCGGCQLQGYDYEKQLAFKENKVRNNLIRIGGIDPAQLAEIMEPIVGMEEPFFYRNKAQYPVGTDREGNPVTGFYAGRTHSIIANTQCYLGQSENQQILEEILDYMKENKVSAYDEVSGRGLLRHILIRSGYHSKEIMVCLIVNQSKEKELPAQQDLLDRLTKIPHMTSISINLNTRRDNVIMGDTTKTLWGKDRIQDSLLIDGKELQFHISPLSFYQVNPAQTEKLYQLAVDYAGLTGKETVWDLYCGIGTISLFMATKAKQVYGVEVIPQAINDAQENARNNGLENATFLVGKAEEVLPHFYQEAAAQNPKDKALHPDVIVVDPPRKGCDEACLSTMLEMAPARIVYVSCDSATLARDVKILCQGGYELKKVRAVDQFAQTTHVETVCLLSKRHEAS